MKWERQKGPWYQVRNQLLLQRGDMEAFWTSDFHYQMSSSRSKVWSWGFGQQVVPSGGEDSQHQVASVAAQTGGQCHVQCWCC